MYSALINVVAVLVRVRTYILTTAATAKDILFVGGAIYSVLSGLANEVFSLQITIQTLASKWLDFENSIPHSLNLPSELLALRAVAYDLLGFIHNPIIFIKLWVDQAFPGLIDTVSNLDTRIMDILRNRSGIPPELLNNPIAFIIAQIENRLGILTTIRANPQAFIQEVIHSLYPFLSDLIHNPTEWIVDHLFSTFPHLRDFLQNPQSYIIETLVNGLEKTLESYKTRLAKIAESILNAIF